MKRNRKPRAELLDREKEFLRVHLVENKSMYQAALAAGYGYSTARKAGARLMKRPAVAKAAELLHELWRKEHGYA